MLTALIEAYEDKHYPIEAPDPVEAIHSHMELFNLPRKALAEVIGSSPRATEVLTRNGIFPPRSLYGHIISPGERSASRRQGDNCLGVAT